MCLERRKRRPASTNPTADGNDGLFLGQAGFQPTSSVAKYLHSEMIPPGNFLLTHSDEAALELQFARAYRAVK